MEPRVGYSIAMREAVVGAIVPVKRRMNVYACTPKRTHCWRPGENAWEMARCSTVTRSSRRLFDCGPTDLTGQMSVPEMHYQNYSDRRERSGVQPEL